jgi:predicted acetyltransferase
MLEIKKPDYILANSYLEMCKDYIENYDDEYCYSTIEEVIKKIRSDIDYEDGNIPKNRLQSFSFWFFDNEELIGTSRLRPKLNERFKNIGGNIGYDVKPSKRRKGYGQKILELTVQEAKRIQLKELLITCDDENIGSYRVIEKNGGKIINLVVDEVRKVKIRRYKIIL